MKLRIRALHRTQARQALQASLFLLVAALACAAQTAEAEQEAAGGQPSPQYGSWTVTGPLLTSGPEGAFDEVAVKDPSIVYYKGNYHLFYTSKPRKGESPYQDSLGYVCAPSLEGLNSTGPIPSQPAPWTPSTITYQVSSWRAA